MLLRHWIGRTGVVLVALVALVAAACAPRGVSSGSRGGREPGAIRVLVYNIHAGKDAHGVDNLARVAALVREVGADIALFQEVDRGTARSGGVDQPAALERLTGFHAAFGRSLDYQGGEYGIAVLARWPVARDTAIHLPVDPPQERAGGSHEPRVALRALIAMPGGETLAVVNTHLDPANDDHWRRQEAAAVASIADSLRGHGTATLVGGDFNSTPESAVQEGVRARGLRDAFAECGRGDGMSYPADVPRKRIDYLYLTGSLRCTEARVLASDASDHRPVLFVVRLR